MTTKAIIEGMAAVVALLGAIITAVTPGITDGPMGFPEWTNVGVLAAGAVMVYNSANLPGYRYAKLVAAVVAAVGVVLISVLSDAALTTTEIVQIAAAILGAAGVGAIRNTHTRDGVFVSGPYAIAG